MAKFTLTFKTPSIEDQLEDIVETNIENSGCKYSDEEKRYAREDEMTRLKKFLETWVEYNEYVIIEFDEKEKTARVCR